MKSTTKFQILIIAYFLVLGLVNISCRKEEQKCGEVIITNGWITSPIWMVNFIDSLVTNTELRPPFTSINVYSIEHNKQIYFMIRGLYAGGTLFGGTHFFTCLGENIPLNATGPGLPPQGTDLWVDLFFQENRSKIWMRFF